MEKIINKDLSLNTICFKINDVNYKIVGTEKGKTNSIYDAIDTVVNLDSGKRKKMRRADLNIMLYKFNAYINKK
tara:strand:- start:101 stop:322 length:222 start_codon:yes stop_codon:yes gene_type:complete